MPTRYYFPMKFIRIQVCFVMFAFSLIAMQAQVQAGPHRPSSVPQEYLITPFGYFHPTCVKHLKEGDTLLSDEGAIQHLDGSYDSFPACSYSHFRPDGTEVQNTEKYEPLVNDDSVWIENEYVTTNTSFGELVAYWQVPSAPMTTADGQIVFFFPWYGTEPHPYNHHPARPRLE